MKFTLPITLLATSLIATTVEAMWKPGPGVSWDYLLGASDSTIKESDKDVVTIDLEYAEKFVPYFHEKGQRVICYFSGGTMQESREIDFKDYQKANIGTGKWSSWGNEYIDIRKKERIEPLIRARMRRAYKYHCDGVEVDSLGVYGHISWISKDDSYEFAKMVAEVGHSEGVSVGLKNCPAIAERLEKYFDFAVVESCAEYKECKHYNNFSEHGKAVFIVHYGDRGHHLSGSSLERLIDAQKGHDFICVLSPDKSLKHHSTTYDCNNGDVIKGSAKREKITNEPDTKEVLPNAANNSTDTTPATKQTTTKTPAKEVNTIVEEKDNNSSNAGTIFAVVAAGGVATTAAVAGFVFVKKNKKFGTEEEAEEAEKEEEAEEASSETEEANTTNENDTIISVE